MDTRGGGATKVPDGGWGWVIVAAVAFINMTNQSILSVFGLLFGAELHNMGHETFTAALITNINSLALNFSGLFIGPAIKSFKPRNVSVAGCLLVSTGMFICAFATASWQFIIGYGFFVGFGLGLISPSNFMAVNAYFSSKRGRAVGVSLAGAGLGQVFLPHVVRWFLEHFSFRCAVVAVAFLALSGVFGALLLKPPSSSTTTTVHNNRQHIKPLLEIQQENDSKNNKLQDVVVKQLEEANKSRVYQSTVLPQVEQSKCRKLCHKLCERLVQALDLELLRDPIFWSIIMGMALVYTATINFTMIFPNFLMYSVGLDRHSTASCMSVMAGADILCRLLLPCITDKLKVPYRVVFLLGTVGLLIARAALAESTDMTSIIVMSIFTGISKSATVLNNNLTVSSYLRPEKLAGGLGLNMISKGMLVITVGQLLGWVRDHTNSYVLCLHAQNILCMLVVLVWTPEIYYLYRRQRKAAAAKATEATPDELEANTSELAKLKTTC